MVEYIVKLDGGDEIIPQGIGEEIWRHLRLFRHSNPFPGFRMITVNPSSVCLFVSA